MTNLCQPEELGLSCMGCCGNKMKGKKEVLNDMKKNCTSFHKATDKKKWGDRLSAFVSSSGICHNLIIEEGVVFCPLHPLRNDGSDLRDRNCDKDYVCATFFQFQLWPLKKQKQFLSFLQLKKLGWYEYSVGMDTGTLLEEFNASL